MEDHVSHAIARARNISATAAGVLAPGADGRELPAEISVD